MHFHQFRGRILRRLEIIERVFLTSQCRTVPRDVELRGHEIALHMLELRPAHGRIELDENLTRFDALTVVHVNGTDYPGFERLDDFGTPTGNDLSLRGGD